MVVRWLAGEALSRASCGRTSGGTFHQTREALESLGFQFSHEQEPAEDGIGRAKVMYTCTNRDHDPGETTMHRADRAWEKRPKKTRSKRSKPTPVVESTQSIPQLGDSLVVQMIALDESGEPWLGVSDHNGDIFKLKFA